jgi:flagellar motor switch protein FliN/FliY
MNKDRSSKIQQLGAEYARSWTRALEGMTGERPTTRVDTMASPNPGTAWWEHRLMLPDAVPVWVGAEAAVTESIGKKILEAAGVSDASPDEVKSTFLEGAAQAISAWGGELATIIGRSGPSDGGYEPRNPDPAATCAAITATVGGSTYGPVFLAFPPALIDGPVEAPEPAMQATKEAAPTELAPLSASVQQSRTLDLLLEVELPVSVSFGRAKLPLKDVLKLTSGAIVELNRSISEPVEVIVNNCVIARGEVVVVEGYYGIRIQQIVSKQERLRSLN